jgi:radical SAM family protein
VSARRTTLRLGLACNNRCVFCAQSGLTDDAGPPLATRLRAARADADELTFVGGEPLLDLALESAIAQARALGFTRVGVQTNGRHLQARAAPLARAGLTDVHVSIHGASAAVHDYHSGAEESFVALAAGVAAARAHGLVVVATTVVTRSNFRVLAALPSWLRSAGAAAWLLELPRAAGSARRAFDRVMPRLGLALPYALHALDAARRLAVPAFIRGAPLCRLGALARHALPDEPRAYGPACAGCSARPACPGVDAAYLARFGGDELQACVAPAAELDAHARLFVGVGPLQLAEEAPPLGPPRAVRLPLADKAVPGRHEVGAPAARKSGAELRAIFPELFRPPGEG